MGKSEKEGIPPFAREFVSWGESMKNGDTFVVLLLLAIAAVWMIKRGRRFVQQPRVLLTVPQQEDVFVPSEEAVRLLNAEGYEIVAGKTKIPVSVQFDDDDAIESRLFIDAYVIKKDELFIVKMHRERQPVDMTGSGARDRLLMYQLLYPESSGVLYVDPSRQSIRKIKFEIDLD